MIWCSVCHPQPNDQSQEKRSVKHMMSQSEKCIHHVAAEEKPAAIEMFIHVYVILFHDLRYITVSFPFQALDLNRSS